MIRNKTLQVIRQLVEKHKRFTVTDFKFEAKGDNLNIRYEYEDRFYFDIAIPSETTTVNQETKETQFIKTVVKDSSYQDYHFKGTCSPGKMSTTEYLDFYGEGKLYNSISSWLDCLWDELLAIPISRQIQEQEKFINDIQERLKDLPDTYFDIAETEELKTKIDALEKKFQEKLESEIEDKNELKRKVEELHNEFETLKATLGSVKKKGWFKSFVTKTFTWLTKEENRKFLNEAKDLIQPLLPDSVKHLLPPHDK
jgi:hypothetical protein